jgi:hypothetical protein
LALNHGAWKKRVMASTKPHSFPEVNPLRIEDGSPRVDPAQQQLHCIALTNRHHAVALAHQAV